MRLFIQTSEAEHLQANGEDIDLEAFVRSVTARLSTEQCPAFMFMFVRLAV